MVKVGSFDVSRSRYEIELEADGYYSIQSMSSGRYIGVTGGSSSEGAKIVNYYNYDTTDGTKWIVDELSNGEYTFSAKCGNGEFLCIDPATNELIQSSVATYRQWYLIYEAKQSENIADLVDLGNLNYWHAYKFDNGQLISVDKVGCWIGHVNVYLHDLNSNIPNLAENTMYAIERWNTALADYISLSLICVDPSNYNTTEPGIHIYGETLTYYLSHTLEEEYKDKNGYTITNEGDVRGKYVAHYGGEEKSVMLLKKVDMFIPNRNRSSEDYRQTILHELGHALGFFDHCINSTHTMYGSGATDEISNEDLQHIITAYSAIRRSTE